MNKSILFFKVFLVVFTLSACGQTSRKTQKTTPTVAKNQASAQFKTGAEQTELYLPLLKGKRVGMVVNPTSVIGTTTTVDSLLKRGVKIVKIFGPEHGFRGNASAGVHVGNEVDAKTGIKVVSLYGKQSTPSKENLADIDVMIFDIQDVGVRF